MTLWISVSPEYTEAKSEGLEDSEILDLFLGFLRKSVAAEGTHNIGKHKTKLYVEHMRKLMAERMFLGARSNTEVEPKK